jgi:hypothetical protein
MWLAGGAKPDYNMLNDFRGKRLKDHLQKIFSQVVVLLAEEGVLLIKEITLDGTKLEANANRYTFVWGKVIKTSRERIEKQLNELWKYVEEVYQTEENTPTKPEFKEINPASVSRVVEEINEALKEKEVAPKIKQKLNYARKNWTKKLSEYEEKEEILAGRNSYSKTDEDATFMRMKDEHIMNGQLKPATICKPQRAVIMSSIIRLDKQRPIRIYSKAISKIISKTMEKCPITSRRMQVMEVKKTTSI